MHADEGAVVALSRQHCRGGRAGDPCTDDDNIDGRL